MKSILLFILSVLWIPFVGAQGIIGTWNGKLVLPNGSLRLVFHVTPSQQGYSSTLNSPDQGANGIPTGSTTFANQTLTISIPTLNASYKGTLKEDGKIYGTFIQGVPFPLNLTKEEVEKPKRPQESQPPFAYQTEEVRFRNEQAGITLAGTLTMPRQGTKFPAVVLVTGSGPQNRDEEIMGHKPFLVIADQLTRNGIAVLRFDDRGTGESEGDFQTSPDLLTDTEAAVNYLQSRKDINRRKIGILGHSEGGSIAIRQAAGNKGIAFIVLLASPGVRGDSLMLKQAEAISKSQGATDIAWSVQAPILRSRYTLLTQDKTPDDIRQELYAHVLKTIPAGMKDNEPLKKQINAELNTMTSPWYLHFMKYDPTADLKRVKCPVLALNGTKDIQVDAEMNLTAIESLIQSNGNKQVTTTRYPELNHLFQHCQMCTINEYAILEETISPEVLKDITDWMVKVTTAQ